MKVEQGDTVTVEYKGTLDDGTLFDTTDGKDPITFEAGSRGIIKGFNTAVIGLKVGQEKKVKINAEEAYGNRNEKLVHVVPKEDIKKSIGKEPEAGMLMQLKAKEDGKIINAIITKVEDDKLILDMNHPLAGKNLNFNLKVTEIKKNK